MSAIYLTEDDVKSLLDMNTTLELTEEAFRSMSEGKSFNMVRQRMRIKKGALHLLPAAIPYKNVIGYKAYTSFRAGLIFKVYLHCSETGNLLAVIDANEVGRLRTGAASGIATKFMAKKDATTMLLYGAGSQSETQLEAIVLAHKLSKIYVTSRKIESAEAFATKMSTKLNIDIEPVADPKDLLSSVDIITTVTTANKPLFAHDDLNLDRGIHINGAGSNSLIRAEIPEKSIEAAKILAVDSKEVAEVEAGDLLPSLEKGRVHWNEIVELGDIIAGTSKGRNSDKDLTIFLSQGMGLQDLMIAEYVYKKALENKIGTNLPF